MDESDDLPGSVPEQTVERGETYVHDEYGRVEVTGIWRGVEKADSARQTDETDTIIVRYVTEKNGKSVGELVDMLDEFLAAVE